MNQKLHFITGLPRSGSTLLSSILKQNSAFHAGVTSPIASIFATVQTALSGKSEFHSFIDNEARSRILTGLFSSFYRNHVSPTVVFDTNRSWSSKIPALSLLFPNARFIICVREISEVINSIESLHQNNPLEPSRIFSYNSAGTIYDRVNDLIKPTGLVGHAYNGIKEAYYGAFTDRIVMLPYRSLVQRPDACMESLYEFLSETPFKHDFHSVHFSTDEYDRTLGVPGLHTVRPRLEARQIDMVLPRDLLAQFTNSDFWNNPDTNARHVRVL